MDKHPKIYYSIAKQLNLMLNADTPLIESDVKSEYLIQSSIASSKFRQPRSIILPGFERCKYWYYQITKLSLAQK